MPLEFSSISHGPVAFGFFNIKTDMLLLQERFFFADRFCAAVRTLAAGGSGSEAELASWRIDQPDMIGNLHGAIAGVVLSGFIGATYARWPFPKEQAGFKQDPGGQQTQDEVEALISPMAEEEQVRVHWNGQVVSLGDMSFTLPDFSQLVMYVDRGGYPKWKDDRRPGYVAEMMDQLREDGLLWLGG